MNVIEVEGLSKTFKFYRKPQGLSASFKNLWQRQVEYKEAVKDVSFSIEQGQVVAFLGANGAGKTTTMKMLSGILHPTHGKIKVLGHTPSEREEQFKKRFSILMGQKQQLWPDLPAIDSFSLCQRIYDIPTPLFKQRLARLSEVLNVSHLLDIQVRRLSLGERMKMELIAALLHGPELLFLDEPTIGLDFLSQRAVMRFLQQLVREDNITILLTSHNMADISALCERVLVIQNGQLVFDDRITQLQNTLGGLRRIHIESESPLHSEFLGRYGKVINNDVHCAELEVGDDVVNQVLQHLLKDIAVKDIRVSAPPLEDSLERLYTRRGQVA
ncbi:ATP-binding cassette domain-containing protein [Pseudoalteromonas sp. SMS1]|uniref:ABC transporter ATP-binding protein n=1 Tax=Pseudoalteromonas sp. SMS1 TaxID=2908894 RepID=UPI001F2F6FC9|nr:ATP-binding cassette domain-containing protein [Pseudoalteromonas sp. SMS1]MCF2859910.1 ATP-binding cassette domain-containing protein [Pseudoalteromonas sp. SMS1]